MGQPGFWDDQAVSQQYMTETQAIQSVIQPYTTLLKDARDIDELLALNDPELEADIIALVQAFSSDVQTLDIQALLNEPYDKGDALLSIHAGAGGLDAQDWASMLVRMYERWLDKKAYSYRVIDAVTGDHNGIKSTTLLVSGPLAYGYLKTEFGVHRLVRISPFNAKDKRQTSFAAVDVTPHSPWLATDIQLAAADLKIDTYRASGAGGQHVNKTDSAVRITHLPTKLVAQSQNSRSQAENRDMALSVLKSRLLALMKQHHLDSIDAVRGDMAENTWGSQIRSYVLYPYKRVKDHRTEYESSDTTGVLDGDLDAFMYAALRGKPHE